jgi:hypothetical protein
MYTFVLLSINMTFDLFLWSCIIWVDIETQIDLRLERFAVLLFPEIYEIKRTKSDMCPHLQLQLIMCSHLTLQLIIDFFGGKTQTVTSTGTLLEPQYRVD